MLALAAAVTLAGCSAGGAGDAAKTTELSFMMWQGETTDPAYEAAIAEFEEANPDITVNVEFVPSEDYPNILRTRLSGGQGPDVYGMRDQDIAEFVRDGFTTDLSQAAYFEKLTDAAQEESLRGSDNGTAPRVPIAQSGNGFLYNTELFEQAGIAEAPQTYTELIDACKKLLAAGVTPIAMSAKDNWYPQFILYYAVAEHAFAEDLDLNEQMVASETSFSESAGWAEALDIFKELQPYYMPDPLGTDFTAAQSAFTSGEAAMFPATWGLGDAREADLPLGYMNFPTVDEPVDVIWGSYQVSWAVNPNNDKVEAAQKFIDFFFEDDVYTDYLKAVSYFPTTTTVTIDETNDPLFPVMEEAWAGKIYVPSLTPSSAAIQDALLVGLQDYLADRTTRDDLLASLDVQLEALQSER